MHLAVAMLIIFGTAKLLAEVFERLGTPGIVGEILAGLFFWSLSDREWSLLHDTLGGLIACDMEMK